MSATLARFGITHQLDRCRSGKSKHLLRHKIKLHAVTNQAQFEMKSFCTTQSNIPKSGMAVVSLHNKVPVPDAQGPWRATLNMMDYGAILYVACLQCPAHVTYPIGDLHLTAWHRWVFVSDHAKCFWPDAESQPSCHPLRCCPSSWFPPAICFLLQITACADSCHRVIEQAKWWKWSAV